MINFLMSRDILNCFSVGGIVMTKESASNSFSLSSSSQKSPFFAVLMYVLYSHPRFQVQTKISTLFPDYLSVSYEYAWDIVV